MSSESKFKIGDYAGLGNSGYIGRVIGIRHLYVVEWPDRLRDERNERELYEPTEAQRSAAKQAFVEKAKQKMMEATAEWQKLQE